MHDTNEPTTRAPTIGIPKPTQEPLFEQMSLEKPQGTRLTNRRRAWRRRQNIPYMYSRWASGSPPKRYYLTDAERRDTYRCNADFISKSSLEEHRDAIRYDTHKPTPSVETPTKDSTYSLHELSKGTRQNAGKSTLSVETPVVAKQIRDSWPQENHKTRH
jgi:hypothetical protein